MRGDIGLVDYHLGFFHTTNHDDILFQTTGRATGLFANVDKTRHLGFEGALSGSTDNPELVPRLHLPGSDFRGRVYCG